MKSATIAILASLVLTASAAAQQGGGSDQGPDPALVEKIGELGGQLMRVAANDPSLEVSFHLGRNQDGLRQVDTTGSTDAESPPLDGELALLGDLEQLVSLHLGGTDVTDAGLAHLAGLASLQRLHLEKTRVTDAGLAHLAGLENLSYLNLYQTEVTDAGLAHLEGLKNLKSVYLWQSKVTPDGAERLRKALPECEVDMGWEAPEPAAEAEQPPEPEDSGN